MICKNCGNQLAEGLRFCGVCGAKVEPEDLFSSTPGAMPETPDSAQEVSEGVTEEVVAEENAGFNVDLSEAEKQPDYDFFNPETEPVKKRKKWPIVLAIVGVVLAALVALAIIFWDTVMALWMHMQPAEKQLQYTYYRFTANTTAGVADDYQKALDTPSKPMSVKGSVALEINGMAKDFIGDRLGISLGELSKVSIDYAIDTKDTQFSFDSTLKVGDESLFDVVGYIDLAENEVIMDLPGILEEPVRIEIPNAQGADSMSVISSMDSELIQSILPDPKLIETLIPRLVEVAFQQITDVSIESEKISAGKVDVNANCLEAEISQKTVIKMGVAILEELENNKDFGKYLETLVNNIADNSEEFGIEDFDADDAIDEVYDGLKEARKALKKVDASSKTLLSIKTYVDFHYNILGIEAEVEGLDTAVGFFALNHGGKLGYEIYAESNGVTLFEIIGNGNKNGDIYSVKFDLNMAIDGSECQNLLTLDVKNFDAKAFEEGMLIGSFEISPSSVILENMGLSLVDFASPSVKFTFEGKLNESSKCTVSLNAGGQAIVSLIFDATMSDKADVSKPEGAVDQEDAEFNEDAIEDFVEKIEDIGLPLGEIQNEFDNGSYEDSYVDDYDDYYDDVYDDYYSDYFDDDYSIDYSEESFDDYYASVEQAEKLESLW